MKAKDKIFVHGFIVECKTEDVIAEIQDFLEQIDAPVYYETDILKGNGRLTISKEMFK